jgi:D-sedoheptulose 7-phosphate isomerase
MLDAEKVILNEFLFAKEVLENFINDKQNIGKINAAAVLMSESIQKGGKIISCGNGGSSCDAIHFAEELSGKFRHLRPAIPALAISDPGFITCVANDFGYDQVFSRFIESVGKAGDVLLALSTSGKSKNVIEGIKKAKNIGIACIALTGNDGGEMAKLADLEIRVPYVGYADRIQEIHIKIIHTIILLIEKYLGY